MTISLYCHNLDCKNFNEELTARYYPTSIANGYAHASIEECPACAGPVEDDAMPVEDMLSDIVGAFDDHYISVNDNHRASLEVITDKLRRIRAILNE